MLSHSDGMIKLHKVIETDDAHNMQYSDRMIKLHKVIEADDAHNMQYSVYLESTRLLFYGFKVNYYVI